MISDRARTVLVLVGLLAQALATTQQENRKESPTAKECPDGWDVFEDHCYLFVGSNNNVQIWSNAEIVCEVYWGAHLASIHSKAEQEFLLSYLNSSFKMWLGATDLETKVCFLSQRFLLQMHNAV